MKIRFALSGMQLAHASIALLVTLSLLPELGHTHGAIPIPLDAVNKILDAQFPQKKTLTAADVSSFPPIGVDLDAVGRGDRQSSKQAYQRLMARGDEIIPKLVSRLTDPEVSLAEKMRLFFLLGSMRSPGTERDIIAFAELLRGLGEEDRGIGLKPLYFQTFRVLAKFKDKTVGVDYALALIADENLESVVRAQAVFFLADRDAQQAKALLEVNNYKDVGIDEQYALIYLGGRLGTDSNIERSVNFLLNLPKSQKRHKYETHKLLNDLTRVIDADEMGAITSAVKKQNSGFSSDRRIDSYPLLAKLYHSEGKQRQEAALALFNGWSRDRSAAIQSLQFMITENDARPYVQLWRFHNPALLRILQNLGLVIDSRGENAVFATAASSYRYQMADPGILVKSLMTALTNNDIDSFVTSRMMGKGLFAAVNPGMDKKKLNELYDEFRQGITKGWRAFYDKSLLDGVIWPELEYKSYEIDVLVGLKGEHLSTITIHLEDHDQSYNLLLRPCLLFDGRWYVASGLEWQ